MRTTSRSSSRPADCNGELLPLTSTRLLDDNDSDSGEEEVSRRSRSPAKCSQQYDVVLRPGVCHWGTKFALVLATTSGFAAALVLSPVTAPLRRRSRSLSVISAMAANVTPHGRKGEECLHACRGPGLCPDFCGPGVACCQFRSVKDPLECAGIVSWDSVEHYTCVVPVNIAYRVDAEPTLGVQHWAEACWKSCGNNSGYCEEYCGLGMACCRFGAIYDAPECHGIVKWGSKDRHTCVAPADPVYKVEPKPPNGSTVKNWGKDCLSACGKSGYCSKVCGAGNTCCRWGDAPTAPECSGILSWGSKEHHTCVTPVNAVPGGHRFAEDCLEPCSGAGYCEGWCGEGGACCRYNNSQDPRECRGVAYFPTYSRYTCVKASGASLSGIPEAPAPGSCIPGERRSTAGVCEKADGPELMTFYTYHPSRDARPVLENSMLGNLEGVLWYLQKHVVNACPRTYHINRVIRYVVTVRNTRNLWDAKQRQFAALQDFQGGACPDGVLCKRVWEDYGYVVGCGVQDTSGDPEPNYASPTLYSLPGGLSEGGECTAPDGGNSCTWKAEYAGEVRIDELSGITDDASFCRQGKVEYNATVDAGTGGPHFWDQRRDAAKCRERAHFLRQLFKSRYPNYPEMLGEPVCDSVV